MLKHLYRDHTPGVFCNDAKDAILTKMEDNQHCQLAALACIFNSVENGGSKNM